MMKMFNTLLEDIVERAKTPEAQLFLKVHVLRPIISSVMGLLYPYLLGVMLLWLIMFVCVALILLILVRGSLTGILGK